MWVCFQSKTVWRSLRHAHQGVVDETLAALHKVKDWLPPPAPQRSPRGRACAFRDLFGLSDLEHWEEF